MNRVVRHAIACGCPPVTAIQMATLNAAEHFGMSPRHRIDRAGAAGGRGGDERSGNAADRDGDRAGGGGRGGGRGEGFARTLRLSGLREAARSSLARCWRPPTSPSPRPSGAERVTARVIGVVENQAPTQALERELPVRDGLVEGEGVGLPDRAGGAPPRDRRRDERLRGRVRLRSADGDGLHGGARRAPHDRRRHLARTTWRWR